MDLLKLQCKLKMNPTIYELEFNSQLNSYKTLITIPLKPLKETNNLINFLTFSTKFYKSNFPKLLLEHFQEETEPKIKKEIFQCIFRLKTLDFITELDFFKVVLKNKQKISLVRLRNELKKKRDLNERVEIFNLFREFLFNGDVFQRPLCAYLILFLYENLTREMKIPNIKETILECLFKEKKISKMIIFYFLNTLDFKDDFLSEEELIPEAKNEKMKKKRKGTKRLEDKINEEKQKEMKLLSQIASSEIEKSKIFYDLKFDEAKKLSKELLEFLKSSKEEREIRILRLKIIGILKVHFNLKIKLYDFVLNLVDTKNEDLKIVMSILIDSLNENEVDKCVKRILNTFCLEFKDDDWIVYGLNLLTEVALKYEFIRSEIREQIEIFKKSKQKSIFYAFGQCMRAAKYGKVERKEVDFIKRKRIKGIKEANY
ncbi:hypothetical protein CDIK_0434 [Cucumispora dikerogammari]|nr:hypothetical protein CDIK_0434 [Cucumispora dikerogammari]